MLISALTTGVEHVEKGMDMSGIVVGVDHSETARFAAEKAAELAVKLDERLHLVMAMKPGRSQEVRAGTDRFYGDWISEERQFLKELVNEFGVSDATVAIGGKDPARSLCDEARRLDATMIVVGNRRAQGAARILGSIASDVVRSAPCDVLVADTTSPRPDEQAPHSGYSITSADVFQQCNPKQRRAIDELATPIAVSAGQELTREGRTGKEFGVLLDGSANVTIDGETVATLHAGDHFGEMALLAGSGGADRSATVTADSDMWVSMMSVAEFDTLVSRFPDIAERLDRSATDRAGAH